MCHINDMMLEALLTEQEAIEALGLADRPNPRGALRWLLRTKQLAHVRLGRGVLGFRKADIAQFVRARHVPCERPCRMYDTSRQELARRAAEPTARGAHDDRGC